MSSSAERVGTLNHTLLTLRAALDSLTVSGLILWVMSIKNQRDLQAMGEVSLLARVPQMTHLKGIPTPARRRCVGTWSEYDLERLASVHPLKGFAPRHEVVRAQGAGSRSPTGTGRSTGMSPCG